MRNFIAPEGFAGRRQRRAHDFEVFGSLRIGADEQPVAMMFDIIMETRRAGFDKA